MKHLLPLVLFFLSIHLSTSAAKYKADEEIEIKSHEYGDHYLAGREIIINAYISGDLIAGAENIYVKDTVSEDLLLGAGKMEILGYVGDDARLSGGEIVISSHIGGDLVVFGGEIRLTQEGSVGGDVIIYGGEILIFGDIQGDLISAGGKIKLKSEVGGNAMIKGGDFEFDGPVRGDLKMSAKNISLGEDALCGGNLTYWNGAGELDFNGIATDVKFDESLAIVEEETDWSSIVTLMGIGVISYWIIFILSSLVVIVILKYFLEKYFVQAADLLASSFVKSFGYGMLFFIGLPVIIVILMISIVGIPIGLLGISAYLLALLFSTTITGMLTAYYFKSKAKGEWTSVQTVSYALLTVIVYKVLFLIPFLGWVLKRIAAAAVYGSLLLMTIERKK